MNVRNYIHLTGNLGAAPSTFVLPSGDLSCKFSLATNEYYRNKAGERVTRTEWHTVRAYGKLAELFANHLSKGSQIAIVGAMRYRSWTDKYEQKRQAAEVIASEFTFLGGGRSKPGEETQGAAATAEALLAPQATEAIALDVDYAEAHLNEPQPKRKGRSRKTPARKASKKTVKQTAAA